MRKNQNQKMTEAYIGGLRVVIVGNSLREFVCNVCFLDWKDIEDHMSVSRKKNLKKDLQVLISNPNLDSWVVNIRTEDAESVETS